MTSLCRFVQESIRWLVSKGRINEAEAVIRRVAKFNKKTLPDILFDQADVHEQTVGTAVPCIDLFCLDIWRFFP